MRKLLLVLTIFVGIPIPCRSQSAADLAAKYPIVQAYEVRPGILLMPLFSADGQVCEMVIEQHTTNTKSETKMNFGSAFPRQTLQELLAELAPPNLRGKELKGLNNWFGSSTQDGPFLVTRYQYENLTVEVNQMTRSADPVGHTVLIFKWLNRSCVGIRGLSRGPVESRGGRDTR